MQWKTNTKTKVKNNMEDKYYDSFKGYRTGQLLKRKVLDAWN